MNHNARIKNENVENNCEVDTYSWTPHQRPLFHHFLATRGSDRWLSFTNAVLSARCDRCATQAGTITCVCVCVP